jgi:hypothetical protein
MLKIDRFRRRISVYRAASLPINSGFGDSETTKGTGRRKITYSYQKPGWTAGVTLSYFPVTFTYFVNEIRRFLLYPHPTPLVLV